MVSCQHSRLSKVDELLTLPQISPYKESLHFENVTNSMVQLKFYFQEITLLANNFDVRGALVYIDIGLNNIVIYFFESDIDNTKFINAVEPFNPEIIYANTQSVLQNIIRPWWHADNSCNIDVKLLGGDGVYNKANRVACSAGFWLKHENEDLLYITTAAHCYDNEVPDPDENYFYYS